MDQPVPKYVIIDVDAGCDDAWAILMLIQAEAKMNIKILGITCVAGNTAVGHVVRNVARILQIAQRTDVSKFTELVFCKRIKLFC